MISLDLTALDNLIQKAVAKAIEPHLEQLKPTTVNTLGEQSIYITKKEAAKIAGVCTSSIDNWRRAGDFDPHYFHGSLRIKRSEFMELLESKRSKSYTRY